MDEVDQLVDPLVDEEEQEALAAAAAERFAKHKSMAEAKARAFFEDIRVHNNIWFLCFLDGTGSMQGCIDASKKAMQQVARRLVKEYSESVVKCAAVIFRDPLEKDRKDGTSDENNEHQVLPFGDIKTFSVFMDNVQASGGGDEAEDVAGGLELAIPLLTDIPDTDTVFWAHVSDSFPHGMVGSLHPGVDRHNTSTEFVRLEEALTRIAQISQRFVSFEYHYFFPKSDVSTLAKNAVTKYGELYTKALDDDAARAPIKICAFENLKEAFMNSVYSSVSVSVVAHADLTIEQWNTFDAFAPAKTTTHKDVFAQYGFEFDLAPKEHAVFDLSADIKASVGFMQTRVVRANFPRSSAFQQDLYKYVKRVDTFSHFTSGLSTFYRHIAADQAILGKRTFEDSRSTSSDTVVFVKAEPCGRGRERVVCHGEVCDGVDSILQADLIAMGAGDVNAIVQKLSQPPVVRTPSVFKFSMLDHAAHYDIDAKIAIHTTALWCANMFNRRLARVGPLPKVEILSPIVLEFDETARCKPAGKLSFVQTKKLAGTRLLGECSLQKTGCKWIKYVNNDGSRNWTSMDPNTNAEYVEKEIVLDLFNLATAAWTGTNMVFADLQGVFHMGRFVLTDLAIAAKNQLAFDQTSNLGELAVKKIVREAREEVKGTPIYREFLTVFNLDDDMLARV